MFELLVNHKDQLHEFQLEDYQTIELLKSEIKNKLKIPMNSQRLELLIENKKTVLKNDLTIKELKSLTKKDKIIISLKNLGPQISYKNVFYFEYLGPLIIWMIFMIVFNKKLNSYYILISVMVIFHFFKRILETRFVHIFSNESLPYKSAFRNLFYYWVIFGIFVPLELFYFRDMKILYIYKDIVFSVLFFLCEILNFYCHFKLRKLREEWKNDQSFFTKERKIPSGVFFDKIISPNYTFEILSWLCFIIVSFSFVSILFLLIGSIIMCFWAKNKKQKLLDNHKFTETEKNQIKMRYLIFPYII